MLRYQACSVIAAMTIFRSSMLYSEPAAFASPCSGTVLVRVSAPSSGSGCGSVRMLMSATAAAPRKTPVSSAYISVGFAYCSMAAELEQSPQQRRAKSAS